MTSTTKTLPTEEEESCARRRRRKIQCAKVKLEIREVYGDEDGIRELDSGREPVIERILQCQLSENKE